MKRMGGVEVYLRIPFLTSPLDGGEWSTSRPGRFTSWEIAADTHWIGRWVVPRACLAAVEKTEILPLPGLKPRPSRS
jgi:hypothetical protein